MHAHSRPTTCAAPNVLPDRHALTMGREEIPFKHTRNFRRSRACHGFVCVAQRMKDQRFHKVYFFASLFNGTVISLIRNCGALGCN